MDKIEHVKGIELWWVWGAILEPGKASLKNLIKWRSKLFESIMERCTWQREQEFQRLWSGSEFGSWRRARDWLGCVLQGGAAVGDDVSEVGQGQIMPSLDGRSSSLFQPCLPGPFVLPVSKGGCHGPSFIKQILHSNTVRVSCLG